MMINNQLQVSQDTLPVDDEAQKKEMGSQDESTVTVKIDETNPYHIMPEMKCGSQSSGKDLVPCCHERCLEKN